MELSKVQFYMSLGCAFLPSLQIDFVVRMSSVFMAFQCMLVLRAVLAPVFCAVWWQNTGTGCAKAVNLSSLDIFRSHMNVSLGTLFWVSLLGQELGQREQGVPANLSQPVVLWCWTTKHQDKLWFCRWWCSKATFTLESFHSRGQYWRRLRHPYMTGRTWACFWLVCIRSWDKGHQTPFIES